MVTKGLILIADGGIMILGTAALIVMWGVALWLCVLAMKESDDV